MIIIIVEFQLYVQRVIVLAVSRELSYFMSTACGRRQGGRSTVYGLSLMWPHVDRGGVKNIFSCRRHKWMTPYLMKKLAKED